MKIKEAIDIVSRNNILPKNGAKIAVGMSGGVDSSVAVAILREMGYEVIGITAQLTADIPAAAKVAEYLNIKHHNVDLRDIFNKRVVQSFLAGYERGETPVPCMICNAKIKWGSMFDAARELGAEYLASGHYARLCKIGDRFCIGKGEDPLKDQSYMLWMLTQEQLEHSCFALANLHKEQIKSSSKYNCKLV